MLALLLPSAAICSTAPANVLALALPSAGETFFRALLWEERWVSATSASESNFKSTADVELQSIYRDSSEGQPVGCDKDSYTKLVTEPKLAKIRKLNHVAKASYRGTTASELCFRSMVVEMSAQARELCYLAPRLASRSLKGSCQL